MVVATLVQWIHLLSAVAAVGGVLFLRFVLMPAAAGVPDSERQALMERVVGRFRPILWTALGLLVVTGLHNAGVVAVRGGFTIPNYVYLLMAKMALAFVLIAIAMMLTTPGSAFAGLKSRRPGLLLFNSVLALVIILLSAALRRL